MTSILSMIQSSILAVDVDINSDNSINAFESTIGTIILISVVIGAVIAIWKAVVSIKKLSNNVDQFFQDWSGEPERDGVPERPGILARMRTLEDLRDVQTVMLNDLSEQMTQLSKHVNAELNRNGGSSTKDAAHEALRVAKEIQKTQESESKLRAAWHQRYQDDQDITRREWSAVFTAVAGMIPKTAEEQAEIWSEITESYGNGTILETHPADPDLFRRP